MIFSTAFLFGDEAGFILAVLVALAMVLGALKLFSSQEPARVPVPVRRRSSMPRRRRHHDWG
ncbi:MAG: hypothetical protein HQL53_00220 [Magnetococcales bacterium]|nr:hypothetical protein [Magnetococcales bacterium]